MPNWKKLIVSGSDATLNSLNVITSISGSSISGSGTVSGITGSFGSTGTQGSVILTDTGAESRVTALNNHLSLRTQRDDDDIKFYTGDSTSLRVTLEGNTGNVGIGTASPGAKLDVHGRVDFANDLRLRGTDAAADQGVVRFFVDSSNKLFIDTANDGSNRFVIDSSGNVGIGTTSPAATLEIASGSSAAGTTFRITNAFGESPKKIEFVSTSNNASGNVIADIFGFGRRTTGNNGPYLAFRVWDQVNSSLDEVARFSTSGSLGIGVTNPTEKLQVDGNIHASGSGSEIITDQIFRAAQGTLRFRKGTNTWDAMRMSSNGKLELAAGGANDRGELVLVADYGATPRAGVIQFQNESQGSSFLFTDTNKRLRFHTSDPGENDLAGAKVIYEGFPDDFTIQGSIMLDDNSGDSPAISFRNESEVRYNVTATSGGDFQITRQGNGGSDFLLVGDSSNHTGSYIQVGNSNQFGYDTVVANNITAGGNIKISTGNHLFFDGTGNSTYISEDIADRLRIFVGGSEFARFTEDTSDTISFFHDTTFGGSITIPEYILHTGDGNTYFGFGTDDDFRVGVGGTKRLNVTTAGVEIAGNLTGVTDATFAGDITTAGNIILSGASNEIIKSNGSIRLNIDSDNNQTDRIFIVSTGANSELFRVSETGYVTAQSTIKSQNGILALGNDVTIFRDGANILRTDDTFHANNSIHVGGDGKIYDRANTSNYIELADTINISTDTSVTGDLTVTGTITAQEFKTELVSASVVFESGSTIFGNSSDDIHSFSGSLRVSGSGNHYFSDGNVGIGTTSPSKALDVVGGSRVTGTFTVETGNNHIRLVDTDHSGNFSVGVNTNFQIRDVANSTTPFAVQQSTPANTLFLKSDGYIGIGHSSPQTRLHLSGSSAAAAGIRQSRDGVKIWTQEIDSNGKLQWAYRSTEGGSATQHFTLNDTGQAILHSYGSGNHTGTLAKSLGVDSSGNIIEFTGGSGGGTVSSITSGADNRIAIFNGTDSLEGDADLVFDGSKLGIGLSSPTHHLTVIGDATNVVAKFQSTDNQAWISVHDDDSGTYGALFGTDTDAGHDIVLADKSATKRLVINSSGHVGIGTTSPARNLQIGDGTGNQVLSIVASNTGLSQIGLGDSDDDNRMQIIADHNQELFSIQTGGGTGIGAGKDRLVIDSSGNVGIGTTSPAVTLHVDGFARLNGGLQLNQAGAVQIYQIQNNALRFGTNNTERMRIDASGNVGIGTNSPVRKLHVEGNSGGNELFLAQDTNSTLGTLIGRFKQNDGTNNPFLNIQSTSTGMLLNTGFSTGIPGSFVLQSNGGSSYLAFETNGANERMRIDSSGNVGIGTTSPGHDFHVVGVGSIGMFESSNDSVPLRVKNTGTSVSTIGFRGTTSTSEYHVRIGADGTGLVAYTDNSERMRITSAGSVGIGTTAPAKPLHVVTTADQIAEFESSDSSAKIVVSDTTTSAYINANSANASFGPFSSYSDTGNIRIASGSEVHTGNGVAAFGSSPSTSTKWKVAATVDTSADAGFNNTLIDLNVQGSSALTGDRSYRGLYIDLDSTATGGSISDEVRLYGQYVSLVDTGDADLNHGIEVHTENRNSDASSTMNMLLGIRGTVKAANTEGTISNMYGVDGVVNMGGTNGGDIGTIVGVRGSVNGGNTNKTPSNVYGGFFKVDPGANFASSLGTTRGVYSEVEINGNTTTSTVYAYQGVIDLDTGSHDDLYQLRLDTQIHADATQTGDNWGIFSTGATKHRIEGKVGIGTNSATALLHVRSADETVARFERNDGTGFTAIDIKDGVGTTGNSAIRFSDTGGSPGEINYEHADNSLRINTNSGERLRITSTGNVGIGSTSPGYTLDVAGDINTSTGLIRRGGNAIIKSSGAETMIRPGGSGVITFHNSATMTSSDEKVRIDANGNLLLNNTSANARLDIREDSNYALRLEDASGHYFRVNTGGDTEIRGNVTVGGTITAQEFHTELVSASIVFESGSTIFGNSSDDTHEFTGTVKISGDGSNEATLTESGNGDFTIAAIDDIRLAAGGNDIVLRGASSAEFGRLANSSQDFIIKNTTTDKDIVFEADDGSGGTTPYIRLDGSDGMMKAHKNLRFLDSVEARFGNADDLVIKHNATNSVIDNTTGDLIVTNFQDDGDIVFRTDNGSGGVTSYLRIDGGSENVQFPKSLFLYDNVFLNIGGSFDLRLYHDGNSHIKTQGAGDLLITQTVDDGDIKFFSDNGSGGTTEYFRVDGGIKRTIFTENIGLEDNTQLLIGAGNDLQIYHNGSNTYIENYTSDLVISNTADDADIRFFCDNGSGGVTEYFRVDGGTERVESFKSFRFTDGARAQFGASSDMQIYHDGSNSYISNDTGVLYIQQLTDDSDIVFQSDNGSGGTTEYLRLDGGDARMYASRELRFVDGVASKYGNSGDLGIYHNGTNSYIENITGTLFITSFSLSGTGRIQGIDTVTDSTDAASKGYVDTQISNINSSNIDGSGTATYLAKFSDSNTLTSSGMFQAASNNFSIGGVTTPNARLSVEGSISVGTTSTDVLKLHNSSGVGTIDGYSTRNLAFGSVTNGEVMRIDNTNGRVGIGTTSPGQKLEVAGRVRATTDPTFEVYNSSANRGGIQWSTGVSGTNIFAGGNGTANAVMTFQTNTSEKMRIGSTGLVSIGTTTAGARLHVKHGSTGIIARFEGDTNRYLYTGTDGSGHYIEQVGTTAATRVLRIQTSDGSGGYTQLFLNGGNGTIYTPGDTVKVGIGTITPSAKFNVQGSATIGWGNLGNALILAGTTTSGIGIDSNEIANKGDHLYVGTIDAKDIIFRTGGANNRLTISSGGTATFTSNVSINGSLTLGDSTADSATIGLKHLLGYCENTDVDTGTETIKELALATYQAVFFDYVVKNGTNLRAGTVTAVHDGTNVEFTDTSTKDLGSTSGVTLSVDISGSNMRLRATTTSDNWTIKANIRGIKV